MIQSLLNHDVCVHLINCDTDIQDTITKTTSHKIDYQIPNILHQLDQRMDIIIIQDPTQEQLIQSHQLRAHLCKVILIYTSDFDALKKKKESNPAIFAILNHPIQEAEITQVVSQALVHLYTHNEYLTLNKKEIGEPEGIHKILIVDDENELASNLAELLTPHYHVYQANTGQEAISLVEKIPNLDIVLLDIHLPDYAIDQLCQMIHSTSRSIKIIAMSGNPILTESMNQETLSTIEAFIAKPFIYQELLHLLKKSITHHMMQQSINLATLSGLSSHQNLIHLSGTREYKHI